LSRFFNQANVSVCKLHVITDTRNDSTHLFLTPCSARSCSTGLLVCDQNAYGKTSTDICNYLFFNFSFCIFL